MVTPEKAREYKRRYYYKNREKILAYGKKYYEDNAEERKAKGKERYWADPQKQIKAAVEWGRKNPERKKEIQRRYRAGNLDKLNADWHKRRAIAKANGGSHTAQEWQELLARTNNKCTYCGVQGKMTKDHIIALVNGGTNDISNITPACLSCNSRKGAGTL